MNLAQLKKGQKAWISKVQGEEADRVTLRLMELGMLEGGEVELVHEAPYGGDPIAVRVRGGMIALRRAEAARVQIVLKEERGQS
jgi:ferrous iron transport protein A